MNLSIRTAAVYAEFGTQPLTTRTVASTLNVGIRAVQHHIKKLVDAGLLIAVKVGRSWQYSKATALPTKKSGHTFTPQSTGGEPLITAVIDAILPKLIDAIREQLANIDLRQLFADPSLTKKNLRRLMTGEGINEEKPSSIVNQRSIDEDGEAAPPEWVARWENVRAELLLQMSGNRPVAQMIRELTADCAENALELFASSEHARAVMCRLHNTVDRTAQANDFARATISEEIRVIDEGIDEAPSSTSSYLSSTSDLETILEDQAQPAAADALIAAGVNESTANELADEQPNLTAQHVHAYLRRISADLDARKVKYYSPPLLVARVRGATFRVSRRDVRACSGSADAIGELVEQMT